MAGFNVNLLTNTVVKEVVWQSGRVAVHDINGKLYRAEKLLVSVPVSVMQATGGNALISFDPPLPFNGKPFNAIGFGAVIKVVIKFKKRFWPKDAGFIMSNDLFPTWWTALPDETFLLTGWLGGPAALKLSGETDEVLSDLAIESLGATFNLPFPEVKAWVEWSNVFNWQKNPFILGGYSYATVDSMHARQLITTPLENTLFFCGEAYYNGTHPGTVEAALVTGLHAASLIIAGK